MEHFVSIILTDYELDENLVESILSSAKVGLLESEALYESFVTDNDEQVLRVQLPRQLSITESDQFAETLADKLFEMGYEDFDIEVSAEDEELPFDIADDLYVFMKNDPIFYRRHYFPTMTKISDAITAKKKVNFADEVSPMIKKAVSIYCKKFDLPKKTKNYLTKEDENTIISWIRDEEIPNIRKGDY